MTKEHKAIRDALETMPNLPDIRKDDDCNSFFVWALMNYDAIKFSMENAK